MFQSLFVRGSLAVIAGLTLFVAASGTAVAESFFGETDRDRTGDYWNRYQDWQQQSQSPYYNQQFRRNHVGHPAYPGTYYYSDPGYPATPLEYDFDRNYRFYYQRPGWQSRSSLWSVPPVTDVQPTVPPPARLRGRNPLW